MVYTVHLHAEPGVKVCIKHRKFVFIIYSNFYHAWKNMDGMHLQKRRPKKQSYPAGKLENFCLSPCYPAVMMTTHDAHALV